MTVPLVNPQAGEVALVMNGAPHVLKLTLGALAEMEATLDSGGIVDLVERFETGRFTARDVLALLLAGLRGGGWAGTAADLQSAEFAGGPLGAARKAAQLLARAFALPGE